MTALAKPFRTPLVLVIVAVIGSVGGGLRYSSCPLRGALSLSCHREVPHGEDQRKACSSRSSQAPLGPPARIRRTRSRREDGPPQQGLLARPALGQQGDSLAETRPEHRLRLRVQINVQCVLELSGCIAATSWARGGTPVSGSLGGGAGSMLRRSSRAAAIQATSFPSPRRPAGRRRS